MMFVRYGRMDLTYSMPGLLYNRVLYLLTVGDSLAGSDTANGLGIVPQPKSNLPRAVPPVRRRID